MKFDLKTRKAFATQKCHATKVRGISFLLTFQQWWDIWQQSGHWEQRGPHVGEYCMSRYGDKGAYEIGNVFIQLSSMNVSERFNPLPKIIKTQAEINASKGRKGHPAWNKGVEPSQTTKDKISEALTGRISPTKGLPAHNKGISPPKFQCIHCNKEASKSNLTRWHNDNCKEKANVQ